MKSVFLVAAVALLAAPAMAQDLEAYGEAAGWDIAIDPTLNNGCLMMSEFDDGSIVRIGFDMTTGNGYILSANPAWGDIVEGQTYPVTISLDANSFDGEATGFMIDGLPGADVLFDNPDFFAGLVQAQSLILTYNGNEVMNLDIAGSADAVMKTIECQDAQIAKSGG